MQTCGDEGTVMARFPARLDFGALTLGAGSVVYLLLAKAFGGRPTMSKGCESDMLMTV